MPELINSFLWGNVLIYLMLFTGVYLTFKTRFLQFTHFGKILKTVFSAFSRHNRENGVSPFAAMSAALSGTMGTGNIIGVGIAIAIGGAGALFWMWISSFICMILKFAEVALAVSYQEVDRKGQLCGGPMYYITNGLPKIYWLSTIFCICGALAAFGIGNAAQVGAISSAMKNEFNISPLTTGIVTALFASMVIFGSVKRLTSFTAMLVPFMTVFFFIGAIIVLFINRSNLGNAFSMIFKDVINYKSAGGGVFGFFMTSAIRQGVSKGVFTNEAGMGSAPIVHATAKNTPLKQGYWGIFEVFVDTILMCSLTGLVILSSKSYQTGCGNYGLNLTADAFSEVFGKLGSVFVTVSIALFAFGAIVSWCYYGTKCFEFIFKRNIFVFTYKFAFFICIIFSAVSSASSIFELSDILNGLMAIPNLIALILLGDQVKDIIRSDASFK